jgi:outer membrane protein assembly factor BamA
MQHRRRATWFYLWFAILFLILIGIQARAEEAPPAEPPTDQPAEPSQDDAEKQVLDKLERTPIGPVVKWLFNEKRKYFVMPIISSGPDTGILGGIAWYQTDIFGKDKRDMILGAIVTQSGQDSFMFSWTEPGIPLKDGRAVVSLSLSENPNGGIRYFGVGNRTAYDDVACNYKAGSRGFGLGYTYDFTPRLTLSGSYGFSVQHFGDPKPDFEMGNDRFASRPISQVHPEVFRSKEFQDGYQSGSFSANLSYDSREKKRLMRLGPGYKWRVGASYADAAFGSSYDWITSSVEFAQYLALAKSNKHLICYRGAATHAWGGHVPFNRLPSIGSDTNRGYYSGRFRDDNELEGNLEYRWYATKHIGLAAFADSAKVFHSGDPVHDALFKDYHPALGGGFRFVIPPQIVIRIDYGVSPEQKNFYFTLGESF